MSKFSFLSYNQFLLVFGHNDVVFSQIFAKNSLFPGYFGWYIVCEFKLDLFLQGTFETALKKTTFTEVADTVALSYHNGWNHKIYK